MSQIIKSKAQKGTALLILMLVIIIVEATTFFTIFDGNDVKIEREKKTSASLNEAANALIGYAVSNPTLNSAGYLPSPDLGPGVSTEGSTAGTFAITDISIVGKLPWRTLGLDAIKDGSYECLWYAISGRFKNSPKTSVFNWDTLGQIDVIDINGSVIKSNLAALIISPGSILDGQNRVIEDSSLVRCGGNYDAKNYLDSYNIANAISGEVNYFVGSTNNRQAPSTAKKRFVLAQNDYFNDRFFYITINQIFDLIVRRNDFKLQINAFLDDVNFKSSLSTILVSGAKGTNSVNCGVIINATNKAFCNNWKEMLLLRQLLIPSPILIDGVLTTPCNRVLLFGGKKNITQVRVTPTDKNDPSNYLEGTNLIAFNSLLPVGTDFNGISSFNFNNASADILRCI